MLVRAHDARRVRCDRVRRRDHVHWKLIHINVRMRMLSPSGSYSATGASISHSSVFGCANAKSTNHCFHDCTCDIKRMRKRSSTCEVNVCFRAYSDFSWFMIMHVRISNVRATMQDRYNQSLFKLKQRHLSFIFFHQLLFFYFIGPLVISWQGHRDVVGLQSWQSHNESDQILQQNARPPRLQNIAKPCVRGMTSSVN